jgi:hypothetical protein
MVQANDFAGVTFRPGFRYADKGVFVARQELKDRSGYDVGIFAAPRDFTLEDGTLPTFKEAAAGLGKHSNWLGHTFCQLDFEWYEKELFRGLKNGKLIGQWFVPTRELLCGKNEQRIKIWPENLYDLSRVGDFEATFHTWDGTLIKNYADWYWSCTSIENRLDCAWIADFTCEQSTGAGKDDTRLSLRPCRAEPAI